MEVFETMFAFDVITKVNYLRTISEVIFHNHSSQPGFNEGFSQTIH